MLISVMRKLGVIGLSLFLIVMGYSAGFQHATEIVTAQSSSILTQQDKIFADVYNTISPSIVAISITDPIFGEVSSGSGFVLDKQGHLVTNFHVVDDRSERDRIEVNFFDGMIVSAEVLGSDPDSDIALLKVNVDENRLRPVTFANSDELVIGQTVLAIGSPFGQRWTLTAGIVSALDRTIEGLGAYQIGAVIQTDAAINPGNSGGPLLNLRGEVLGINSQIVSRTRANSGVGFAVPGNLVQRVLNELRSGGFVDYSYLGVFNLEDVNLRVIERLKIPNDTRGVTVGSVTGPAATSGLRINDIITAIDGEPVIGFGSLLAYLSGNTRPEQTVKITVLRNGELMNIDVTLSRRP